MNCYASRRSSAKSLSQTLLFVSSILLACNTVNAQAWLSHRKSVASHPALIRYYTFEDLSADDGVARSIAGEAEPLTYGGKGPLRLVDGSCPEKQAVRLDQDFFQAKPISVSENGFSVEIRFRKHGPGTLLGNGRTNGMLLAQGDGYWNGFRVWTDYPNRRLRFEIGRPKPNSAVGLTPPDSLPDGVWHHVAMTWDGQEMRVYQNGIILQAVPHAGVVTPTTSSFRVGFAGAGIGSLDMDVDEVALFRGALSPGDVFRHATMRSELPASLQQAVQTANDAILAEDWQTAGRAYESVLKMSNTDASIRAVARLALAQTLRRQNRVREAAAEYTSLFADDQAPPALREVAARMCMPSPQDPVHAVASSAVYLRLLELDELTAAQRDRTGLCLAECLLREGRPEAAREQYQKVLRSTELPALQRWNIRLQIAHTYLTAKDYALARQAYAQIAADSQSPTEFRSNAALCFAKTYVREEAYAKAFQAYERIAERKDIPAHLRQEARECGAEVTRIQQGLPPRDPAASRLRLPPTPKPAVTYYVAVDGKDTNPGTQQQPLASLSGARDAIRDLKSREGLPRGGVAVLVGQGRYAVDKTWELTEADTGTPEAPITYQCLAGQSAVFTGGVTIEDLTAVTDPNLRSRWPEDVRDKVLQVDLRAAGVTDFGSIGVRGYGHSGYPTHPWVDLYVDGQPMRLARWPNEGTIAVGQVTAGAYRTDGADKPGQFHFDTDRPRQWSDPRDVWMFGAWGHLWEGCCVQVAQLDPNQRRVTTSQRASYGYREGQPFYFFNVLEELDEPGEWFLDRENGRLYLIPPVGLGPASVDFPVLEEPFLRMQGVRHVTVRGLTFEQGRAEGAVIEGGEHNLLVGCTFRRLGTNGVIIRGGTGHGLLGCDVHTLGAGGVRISGGDRKSLARGDHFVENCHIHDFSRIDRVYAPAVHLDGVGHRVAHNLIHDSPHHAMRVEGYEHAIEFNEVHSVVYEFDDQAGIDMYGNPAYRGNVIRYNFWHHIGSGHNVAGQAGIRLDDFISTVLVYGNVFYRCAGGRFGGVQIHGGKDNVVDNNLFVDCKTAISFSPWGEKRWLERLGDERMENILRSGGVDISRPPHSERWPDLSAMAENPDRNYIWRNLAVSCGELTTRDRGVNELMDNHQVSDDPGFADPAVRDFSLPTTASIYDRFGFRPIPFAEIGLYKDTSRASWPVDHEITPFYVAP